MPDTPVCAGNLSSQWLCPAVGRSVRAVGRPASPGPASTVPLHLPSVLSHCSPCSPALPNSSLPLRPALMACPPLSRRGAAPFPYSFIPQLLHLQGGELTLLDLGGIKVIHLGWCYRRDFWVKTVHGFGCILLSYFPEESCSSACDMHSFTAPLPELVLLLESCFCQFNR